MGISLRSTIKNGIFNVWNKYVSNSPARWEKMYHSGYSLKLDCLDQSPRHYVVAGMVTDLLQRPAHVLDVGCGNGTLVKYLQHIIISYKGIDISDTAIYQATKQYEGFANITFEVGQLSTQTSCSTYDTILFNEVLYYIPINEIRPIVEHSFTLLQVNGVVIISMSESFKAKRIWKMIDELWESVHHIKLESKVVGSKWTVKAYRRIAIAQL